MSWRCSPVSSSTRQICQLPVRFDSNTIERPSLASHGCSSLPRVCLRLRASDSSISATKISSSRAAASVCHAIRRDRSPPMQGFAIRQELNPRRAAMPGDEDQRHLTRRDASVLLVHGDDSATRADAIRGLHRRLPAVGPEAQKPVASVATGPCAPASEAQSGQDSRRGWQRRPITDRPLPLSLPWGPCPDRGLTGHR